MQVRTTLPNIAQTWDRTCVYDRSARILINKDLNDMRIIYQDDSPKVVDRSIHGNMWYTLTAENTRI